MIDTLFGKTTAGDEVRIPTAAYLRHAVCLGSSGSGKTVACKVICEEFVRAGIPVIAVDPQGDIASLAEVAPEEDVVAKGTPAEVRRTYADRAEVVVWTPGSALGVPLSVNPLSATAASLCEAKGPWPAGMSEEDALREQAFAAEALTDLEGYDLDSPDGRYVTALFGLVIQHAAEHGTPLPGIGPLLKLLEAMPQELKDRVASVVDERRLDEVVRRTRMLTLGTKGLLFAGGVPLDIETLLGLGPADSPGAAAPGKTRLSVIYLNTLATERERQFFLGQLAQALYRWMLQHPKPELQALFYVDEVSPYLPPVRKPLCKDALKLLFRQARKYGVSCLVATQSPGDIDYKALSQIATWNLGRLMTRQDVKKVEGVLKSIAPDGAEAIAAALPSLQPGEFVLLSPDVFPKAVHVRVRWLATRHRTLDETGIGAATAPETRERIERAIGAEAETGPGGEATAGAGGAGGKPGAPADDTLAGPASGRAEVAVLAVTGEGEGSVNACEIVVARGTGRITALGGQSRVSKESIKVAWEAASQLQAELDLPRNFGRRYDVTVLDTRLAVKKDGPSAGLAYLTGIIAALRGTLPRPDAAVTGEITILGKVLAVGGIEEKVRAAYESGYSTVLVPSENKGDVAVLPSTLKSAIEVIPVSTIQEALPVIFATPRREKPVPRPKLLPPSDAGGAVETPPAIEVEPEPEPEPEPPPAPGKPRLDDRVRELLQKEPQALAYAEIAERLGEPETSVTSAVRRLNKAGSLQRASRGRTAVFYHEGTKLRPEYGMLGPVEAVKLAIFEPEARRRVEKDLASSFLVFTREELRNLKLAYLPLYQVKFQTRVKEGWLFTREVERRDNLYFNGVTGELLIYVKGTGFSFASEAPANPVEVVDLDDLACLETRLPGDVDLDPREMKALVGPDAAAANASRKFQLTVLATALVFLPVWRALIRDKSNSSERDLCLDGLEGRPIVIGRPHPPGAARKRGEP